MITASQISALRTSTGAGMMDCKAALEEAGGDSEKAIDILRKKGVLKAAKRADKIAAEGATKIKIAGNRAVILELNSETDFVAQGDDFVKLADEVATDLLAKNPANLDVALASGINDKLTALTGKIGEKIALRRFQVVEKSDGEAFGDYVHMGGKISVLTILTGTTDSALAREIGMQVAASNPRATRRDEVDASILEKEKEVYVVQLKAQNKPENIIENIVKGKMEKFYSEACLLEQPFIKDEEKSVQKFLDSKGPGITVKTFYRFELGEGIEKVVKDFAAEVAEQMA
ncbi:MAG: translation elongation factor Ts [Candidatus Magasanikbacteria bacterium RIFOXYC2_FULL_42_28]|uniref:Elongation factor Ts n=1 Tax=Candidatus Magasanikbacteria bacterium RIFOXYC2_FULL_42_28 TaxID=1798704 RepID=A0A1F6NYJ0_9BACT|nr:MAG: translation elongation factor Ts [Candidatus Magasanikbacteria bacterium RIFOXYC2_FULL_42_28]